jgi:predicted negative regulator of RcsB-dependent stress response
MSKTRRNPPSQKDRTSDSGEDQFVVGVVSASRWAQKNQTVVTVFSVVLVVVVVLVWSWSGARERQLQEAGIRLESLQATLYSGDPEAAKVGFSQYLEQFGDTPYAGEAGIVLARLYLDSDQPELAIRSLERVGLTLSDPLGAEALMLEAKAREVSGDLASAEETFMRIADGASMAFQRQDAAAQAARVRAARGDLEGAAELYRGIVAELEVGDADRGFYEMRLAEVEAENRG